MIQDFKDMIEREYEAGQGSDDDDDSVNSSV